MMHLQTCLQGWAAANSTSAGGKPFFLGRLDPAEHCMFFDDHISPLDPKIVDLLLHLLQCTNLCGIVASKGALP